MTLTLNVQGQIWNFLYLCQKWPDCHKTKSKHINWTLGLKCDHQIWPWPWPWPWVFKVKYGICYISTKSGPIARKQKANISIELQASNVTNGFDLGHDLDIWIFEVRCDCDHLVTKVRYKDLPDSDRGDFRCRRAVDSSSFTREYKMCVTYGWRDGNMMTSSNGNIFYVTGPLWGNSPVTGEFPSQRPVMWSFDVFFNLRLNKRVSKQLRPWWFETPSCSLWRHCNESEKKMFGLSSTYISQA